MYSDEPTRQERREARRANGRKMRVSGKSVFVLERLSREPKRRKERKPWKNAR